MKNILPIILIVAAIAGITIYSQKSSKSDSDKMEKSEKMMMESHGEAMEKDSAMMKADDKMAMEKEAVMKKDDKMMMESHGEAMEKDSAMMKADDKMAMEKEAMMKADDKMAMEKEAMMKKPGSFVKYEDINIANIDGNILLDFSATWCPSCRNFKKDVEASLADIPSDLTIVLVDYDTNKDLRKKYKVTRQHTFVQIDNKGNEITKWSGGSTLESLFSKLK